MKKILITIFLMLCCVTNAHASNQTYYSDYSDFGEYTESYIENTDLIDVKKTTMYRYYKEEKIYGEYYLINNNNELFPYADINDFIKTSYTDWNENIPSNEVGRDIKNRSVYYYQDMKKVRYIHFTDLRGGQDQLNINEIFVTENNRNIPYTIYCEGCSDNFFEKVTNQDVNYENSYVLFGGYLRLDLGDYYNLSDLNIRFYLTDRSNSEKRYNISISREKSLNSSIYSNVLSRLYFKHNSYNEFKEISHQLDELNLIAPEWESKVKSYNPIIATNTRRVEHRKEYSYQDTLYRYYNYQRKYANDYYEESPLGYPVKDENDYVEYYQSKHRDKVTLKSKIIIESKEQKLEYFVVENTTNILNVDGIINYERNGIYEVSYIFPFITIDQLVYVNIAENKEPVDGEPVEEEPVDEEPVEEEPVDEEPVDEKPIDEEPVDEEPVEEEPIDEEPVDEEPVDEEPVDEEPIEEEPIDEEPVEEEPVEEEPIDEEPVDEEPIEEEPIEEEPIEEEPVEEEPIEEEPIEEEPIEEGPVDEEPIDEEPIEEEPIDEKPIDEKPIDEKPDEEEANVVDSDKEEYDGENNSESNTTETNNGNIDDNGSKSVKDNDKVIKTVENSKILKEIKSIENDIEKPDEKDLIKVNNKINIPEENAEKTIKKETKKTKYQLENLPEKQSISYNYIIFPITLLLIFGIIRYSKFYKINKKSE